MGARRWVGPSVLIVCILALVAVQGALSFGACATRGTPEFIGDPFGLAGAASAPIAIIYSGGTILLSPGESEWLVKALSSLEGRGLMKVRTPVTIRIELGGKAIELRTNGELVALRGSDSFYQLRGSIRDFLASKGVE